MKCVILASGFGTRMYPLTLGTPKPLLTYKDHPLLSHIVNRLPQEIEVYVTVNRRFEDDFRTWQQHCSRMVKLIIEDVWDESQSLGALGSLENAVKTEFINEDLFVIAGDNYFEFSIEAFLDAYNGINPLIAVYDIGVISENSQYGIVLVENQKVIDFQEKPTQPKSSLVATGCWVLPSRIFPLL
ncbi:sugar phosphate nucleotidyltransferase, partial [Chloroflexota bacterium]